MVGETVTRQRAKTTTDPYSLKQTVDWTQPPDEEPIDECIVYPANTTEAADAERDQSTETLTVLLPHGTDLTEDDRLVIRGNPYEVQGVPFDYVHPFTGWTPGMQATATRWKG